MCYSSNITTTNPEKTGTETKNETEDKTTVLGIGNILLQDEGVGVHIINRLQQIGLEAEADSPRQIEFIDGGTSGLSFLPFVKLGKRLIIIDAMHGGSEPGSVYKFKLDDTNDTTWKDLLTREKMSLHEFTIFDSLMVLKLQENIPEDITVIGIEPMNIDWGLELTPKIANKLDVYMKIIIDEINDREFTGGKET